MKIFRHACLSLLLLTAPLSMAWGDGLDKVNAPAAKSVSKEGVRAARIQKDKDKVRKIVLAKKLQRQSGYKTVKKGVKKKEKVASKSKPAPRKLQTNAKRSGAAPARMGIRTWAFPETSAERTNKINELSTHIRATENAYDAENARYQKLMKPSKEQANPTASKGAGDVHSSQRRMGEIMQQLDALHQHRNAVSEIVFLKSVRD
ncbi:MAG: hypothetical protein G8237_03790 [Magnetococcales bacterium]|nr:hypothetical protein [Magnetococcales bacterium]